MNTVNIYRDRYEITSLVPLPDLAFRNESLSMADKGLVADIHFVRHTDGSGRPTLEMTSIVIFRHRISASLQKQLLQAFGQATAQQARANTWRHHMMEMLHPPEVTP